MKKLLLSLALCSVIGCGDDGGTSGDAGTDGGHAADVVPSCPTGAVETVDMQSSAFVPNTLTVTAGQVVRFINQDSFSHTVTSDTGVWDSGTIGVGEDVCVQFNEAGAYPYHCEIHGSGMSGTITVQ